MADECVEIFSHGQGREQSATERGPFIKRNVNRFSHHVFRPDGGNYICSRGDLSLYIHCALPHVLIIVLRVFPITMNRNKGGDISEACDHLPVPIYPFPT